MTARKNAADRNKGIVVDRDSNPVIQRLAEKADAERERAYNRVTKRLDDGKIDFGKAVVMLRFAYHNAHAALCRAANGGAT